jgi:cytochrome b
MRGIDQMSSETLTIEVWDLFVRVFHWSLVAAFAIAWTSAEYWPSLHEQTGYFIATLIVLRIVWGFIGPRYARFNQFIRPLADVREYLAALAQARPTAHIGHNPAAGWMVIMLLSVLALTVFSGWAIGSGHWEDAHEVAAGTLLALIFVHVAGVVLSSYVHKENLVAAMLNGHKNTRNHDV